MNKFTKVKLLAGSAFVFALGVVGLARAATTVNLGAADSYVVLGGSIVTNTGTTTADGDVGVSPSIGVPPHITGFPPGVISLPGVKHDADANAAAAQAADTAAFGSLDQPCDVTYAGVQNLTLVSPLAAGVYCAPAFTLTGNLTLSGSGVWIFKSASTLITSPGSSVTGGDPCDVWWRVVSSATLDTTTSFIGNILALTSITLNTNASLNGRALAQTGAVTLDTNTITKPVCTAATATLHITKYVTNDNGGTKVISDFPLFLDGASVTSGEANTTTAGLHTVSETADSGYTSTIAGDCAADGTITLASGDDKTCTITNNDIAPILHVVKSVINDNGGLFTASNATIHVKNGTGIGDVAGSPQLGVVSPGTSYNLDVGTYIVVENALGGYSTTYGGDCDGNGRVTLALADDKTCTVTNNDIAPASPVLHIVKKVINDNGGTAVASSAMIHVKNSSGSSDIGGSPQAGVISPGTEYTLDAGTYIVVEDALPGYSATFSGDCSSTGRVTLSGSDDKTCTITNNDTAPGFPNTGFPPQRKGTTRDVATLVGIFAVSIFFALRRICNRKSYQDERC